MSGIRIKINFAVMGDTQNRIIGKDKNSPNPWLGLIDLINV
jgi:hypothetical protein